MKEKVKNALAILLAILVITIWFTIGFGLSQYVITIETILAGVLILVIALIHK